MTTIELKKIKLWVNIYKEKDDSYSCNMYESLEAAEQFKDCGSAKCLKTQEIEVEV